MEQWTVFGTLWNSPDVRYIISPHIRCPDYHSRHQIPKLSVQISDILSFQTSDILTVSPDIRYPDYLTISTLKQMFGWYFKICQDHSFHAISSSPSQISHNLTLCNCAMCGAVFPHIGSISRIVCFSMKEEGRIWGCSPSEYGWNRLKDFKNSVDYFLCSPRSNNHG